MAPELWFAWVAATTAFMMVPGPTILVVIGYALGSGRSSGRFTVPGVVLGDVVAMTASLAAVAAALHLSDALFRTLAVAGGAYLIVLGVRRWRSEPDASGEARSGSGRAMFLDSFVVTAINPRSIVFFMAVLPQFVEPERPLPLQFAILEATFVVLGGIAVVGWILLASGLRGRLASPESRRTANRIGAALLVGAGLVALAARRLP